MLRAIKDVEMAAPDQRVVRILLDELVTGAQIAERTGRSREGIRTLIAGERGPGAFPTPRYTAPDGPAHWLWPEVLEWFEPQFGEKLENSAEARLVAALNGLLETRRQLASLSDLILSPDAATELARIQGTFTERRTEQE